MKRLEVLLTTDRTTALTNFMCYKLAQQKQVEKRLMSAKTKLLFFSSQQTPVLLSYRQVVVELLKCKAQPLENRILFYMIKQNIF